MAISSYLNQLKKDKQDLVDNLTAKGIEGLTGDETFTELVPEVLNVQGLDWTAIGYSGEPKFIEDAYEYAKEIYDNYIPVTDWYQKYEGDEKLIVFPLIDTSEVTSMRAAFNRSGIMYIPELNTSNVTNMRYMFGYTGNIQSMVLNFDTAKVTNMSGMFIRSYISKAKLNFNTARVTTFKEMFAYCTCLKEVDLSAFTSEKLTDASTMFNGCENISKIDIRKLDLTKITSYNNMFGSTTGTNLFPSDCLIIVKDQDSKDWILDKWTTFTNVKTVSEYEEQA